jgi:hypothetical protein
VGILLQVAVEGAIVSSADITPNTVGDAWEIYMDTGRYNFQFCMLAAVYTDSAKAVAGRTLEAFRCI